MSKWGARTCAIATVASIHVAAVALFSPSVAHASPSAKLVYVRGPGAQACPSESDLRQAVALRLGYDPFFPTAPKTVIAQLRRDDARRAYLGTVQIVGDDGNARGSRDLASNGDDCAELVRAIALAVSLALDDLDEAPSPDEPAEPPSESSEGRVATDDVGTKDERAPANDEVGATAERRSSSEPSPPPNPPKGARGARFDASAGPVLSFGTAPAAAFGASAAGALRYGIVGLRLDVRGEWPSSTSIAPRGRVQTNTVLGSLSGCAYAKIPFVCVGAGMGVLWSTTDRITSPASDEALVATALARIGADFPIGGALYLEPFVEGAANLTRHSVAVNGANVFTVPLFAATTGIHVGGHFFLMGEGALDQASGVEPREPESTTRSADVVFRELFDAHVSYVAASLGRLGIDARDRDDLVSEVFVRVHRELETYERGRPIRPWLFAFAARVASEHRRLARHRREVLGEPLDVASTEPAPDRRLEEREARRVIHDALETLDIDKRAVFVLHDLDDTPVPEIARALKIPEGTAYSRLRAARAEFTAAVRRAQLGGRS